MLDIALAAHVDAGKTTLSEYMLYLAGVVRAPGRVDQKSTFLDTDRMERARGITIFSKQARLNWNRREITLLDTPGHVDFSGEALRTLQVADACVLVVSAPDGVLSHTRALWELMERLGLPVWIFVNKMDRFEGSRQELFASLRQELDDRLVDELSPDAAEQWALADDTALDYFLKTGEIPAFHRYALIAGRKAFPVFFGSALKGDGVRELMDHVSAWRPARPEGAFSARVFKAARDPAGARLCFMKVLSGTLRPRDSVSKIVNGETVWSEKVTALRLYSGAQFVQTDEAGPGQIVAAVGMKEPEIGDVLGAGAPGKRETFIEPVYSRRVRCANADLHTLLEALKTLEDEEPLFSVETDDMRRAVTVRLSGQVQSEVLSAQLKDRFGLDVTFEEPRVVFRETILEPAEGVGHYEPLRHYAEVHLWLSPGERGSGVTVTSELPVDDLKVNWQQQILTSLRNITLRGVLIGAELTDIRIALIAGKAHLKHTEGGDFREAARRALRQGLMKTRSMLLEPEMAVDLTVPREALGKVIHVLSTAGASFETPSDTSDMVTFTACAAARRCIDLPMDVRLITGGRGRADMRFARYVPCGDESVIRSFGYDPERDLTHPADSVFCAHGAGFNVPWREVDAMAHLPLRKDRQADTVPPVRVLGPVRYHGTAEEDAELLKIFERTYGPVKARQLIPVKRKEPAAASSGVKEMSGGEVLLVDGYNMVFAWDELKKLAQSSLDDARRALCDMMCEYSAMTGRRVIVVFDAYRVSGGIGGAEKYGNIFVIYTRERETADAFIEKATYQVKGSLTVLVATSDGPEQAIVIGNDALRLSASDLNDEMRRVRASIRDILEKGRQPWPVTGMEEKIKAVWKEQHSS